MFQVCRDWRDLVSSSIFLWSRVAVNKKKLAEEGLASLVAVPRLRQIRHFDLSNAWFDKDTWNDILHHMVNFYDHLDFVDITLANLYRVNIDLLAEVLCKSRSINLSGLESKWLVKTLEVLYELKCGRIENLCLDGELYNIPDDLLLNTLTQVKHVTIESRGGASLGFFQHQALVDRCKASGTELSIKMKGNNICDAPIAINSALRDLTETSLQFDHYNDFSTNDWNSALGNLSKGRSKLKTLNVTGPFTGINLKEVDPVILSTAFSRLSSLGLSDVLLSETQWTSILKLASLSSLSLRMINMTSIDPDLLARSLSSCSSLSLDFVALNQLQWVSLLESMMALNKTRRLRISSVDLSKLPSPLLCSVLTRCKSVDLSFSSLTLQQLNDVLKSVITSSLQELILTGVDLSSVPESSLARAVTSVTRASLAKTKLTGSQVTSVLAANLGRSRLRHLDLGQCRLGGADSEVMALSLSRLQSVNMYNSLVTRDQLARLVTQVDRFSRLELVTIQSTSANLLPYETRKYLSQKLTLDMV